MQTRATSAQVARHAAVDRLVSEVGPWTSGSGPRYRQLARAVAHGIDRGALLVGWRLPSERVVAAALGISRGTAVAAYDLLVGDGLVERRRGSGTFVAGAPTAEPPPGREGTALVHQLVDASSTSGGPVDLSLSVLADSTALGSFTLTSSDLAGVDPETGYSPWGLAGLRDAIAAQVTRWGLPTVAGQVVVTTGAQQAITVAAACWVRPGDTVVVDDPTYPGAIAAFTQAGARLVGVPVDEHGIMPGPLAEALEAAPALVYLQPVVHSPTGVTTSEARRRRIAAIVAAARVPLVEDRALADLAWGRAPPPIAAFEQEATSLVLGSIGKRFWGGLRVGFLRAAEPLALRAARVKATQDLGSSAVSQVLAEQLLRTTGEDHRRALTNELRHRYEVLAGELARSLPTWSWPEPTGGLSIWVRLPGTDAATFARAARREGVVVAAPGPLTVSSGHRDRVRISFAASPEALTNGVARLATAWARR